MPRFRSLRRAGFLAAAAAAATSPLAAQVVQERVDLAAARLIREEGLLRSTVDSLAGYLTDVIGSRLTNSPGNRRANQWAAEVLRGWGLAKVEIQPWDVPFGRGWEQVAFSARVVEPVAKQLHATPQAWSGSTRGTVTCPVVLMEVTDTAALAAFDGKLRGACVMFSPFRPIGPEFEPEERRLAPGYFLDQGAPGAAPQEGRRSRRGDLALLAAIARFLRTQQPAAVLRPASWTYGLLRTGGHLDGRLARDSSYNPVPDLQVGHEQYGQLYRNARRGIAQKLELNVQNRFLEDDRRGYNVVAEIPGTDRAGEAVMLGAHFDSWHSGTGATDNAAGSVVMMEAMRILKRVGLPMRRTVRIALWSGEEQGLYGSAAWVRMHQAEAAGISAYLNLDSGTGKIRGIYNQLNTAVTPVFEQLFTPLRDLGVIGVRHEYDTGSDHLSFDAAGIPGFSFVQDPIEYSSRSHHSYVDTYERLLPDDLRQAATVVAYTAFHLANRDGLLPRNPAPRPTRTGN